MAIRPAANNTIHTIACTPVKQRKQVIARRINARKSRNVGQLARINSWVSGGRTRANAYSRVPLGCRESLVNTMYFKAVRSILLVPALTLYCWSVVLAQSPDADTHAIEVLKKARAALNAIGSCSGARLEVIVLTANWLFLLITLSSHMTQEGQGIVVSVSQGLVVLYQSGP